MQMLTHDNEPPATLGSKFAFAAVDSMILPDKAVLLTQKNLHGALAHVVVAVEGLSLEVTHLLANVSAVVIEKLDEALQNVEVECWRD
jgi:molybdopterin-guanine dinucleotide biosynthesis protein A